MFLYWGHICFFALSKKAVEADIIFISDSSLSQYNMDKTNSKEKVISLKVKYFAHQINILT